ncbi:rhomboid-related protein 2-like [Aricia agestis]|uniref:rhomboid-related protein 2-like n=1 Tax=Aricia agestis TaxID=91739 RepID=UPI001C2022A8|nr:rhomboid-related protein 2-like [Aricia agestis]XP_041977236.1 rhomboid-related protein 2-like [Aricia agestis]XP_041977237.1 rhomboid-related protein 2-like [Aricia agestis]
MAPDADCEEARRPSEEYAPVHQGRRILPDLPPPARAWTETEDAPGDSRTNSPGESRRLLGHTAKSTPRRQYEINLTLTRKTLKCPPLTKQTSVSAKTKFQKRKEKILDALRPPYFIISMIAIIVLLHLCGPARWQAHLEWLPGPRWSEPWRLLSYGLVHATPMHLVLNSLVALAVGWRLEREQGWARVALVWVSGVGCGALGASALQPRVKVVGASAAVYALLTAHIPNVCLRYGHVPLWWFRPLSVLVLGASEGVALLHAPSDGSPVAWPAHVFGALLGLLLGFIVFTGENSSKAYIEICRVGSFVLLMTGVLTMTVFYIHKYQVELGT